MARSVRYAVLLFGPAAGWLIDKIVHLNERNPPCTVLRAMSAGRAMEPRKGTPCTNASRHSIAKCENYKPHNHCGAARDIGSSPTILQVASSIFFGFAFFFRREKIRQKGSRRTDCCATKSGRTIEWKSASTGPGVSASLLMVSLPLTLIAAVAICRGEVLDANFDELYDIVQVMMVSTTILCTGLLWSGTASLPGSLLLVLQHRRHTSLL